MRSRTVVLIVLCALGLLAVSLAAVAQPPAQIPQIGVLNHGRQVDEPRLRVLEEFWQGLHDLGYVEGQNIALAIRWAEGSVERLHELAAELVRLKVDVLVVFGPPGVRAARAATNTIPIVMARMDDAEEHGFGFCRKVQFLGQNPKIGYQKFNDLQTAKLSKKQLCDRTIMRPENERILS